MSRYTDEELRAAFRLRAVGRPNPGLLQRVRQSTRPQQERRGVAAIDRAERPRPILARLTAIASVAAVLILAPVVFGVIDAQRLDRDQTVAGVIATPITDGEIDGDDDDIGDDEDGINEDDEADADDVGDDEDDEADADDVGDDEDDPEESDDDD